MQSRAPRKVLQNHIKEHLINLQFFSYKQGVAPPKKATPHPFLSKQLPLIDTKTERHRWINMDPRLAHRVAAASGDPPFTTGAAVQVDGGMHIHQ